MQIRGSYQQDTNNRICLVDGGTLIHGYCSYNDPLTDSIIAITNTTYNFDAGTTTKNHIWLLGRGSKVLIGPKGRMSMTYGIWTSDTGSASSDPAHVRVDGSEASLNVTAAGNIFIDGPGSLFEAKNKASMKWGKMQIRPAGVGTQIVVDGGATNTIDYLLVQGHDVNILVDGGVYLSSLKNPIGVENAVTNFRMTVSNGGLVRFTGGSDSTWTLGGSNALLRVESGSVFDSTKGLKLGGYASTLSLAGKDTRILLRDAYYVSQGSFYAFSTAEDRAAWPRVKFELPTTVEDLWTEPLIQAQYSMTISNCIVQVSVPRELKKTTFSVPLAKGKIKGLASTSVSFDDHLNDYAKLSPGGSLRIDGNTLYFDYAPTGLIMIIR